MRKFTYIDCPECGKEFQSLGYASHRAMHRRERERAKKLQQPPVIKSVCLKCEGTGNIGFTKEQYVMCNDCGGTGQTVL